MRSRHLDGRRCSRPRRCRRGIRPLLVDLNQQDQPGFVCAHRHADGPARPASTSARVEFAGAQQRG
uniref:Uncharacterized protein n=1 Tax=Arundo donax TaxID=35708 RepID=A0A0A9C6C5_ARUDO